MDQQPPLTREEIIERVHSISVEWDYGRKPTYGDTEIDIAKMEGRNDVLELVINLLREIEARDG